MRRTARGTSLSARAFLLSSLFCCRNSEMLFVAADTREVGSERSRRRPFFCSAVAEKRSSRKQEAALF